MERWSGPLPFRQRTFFETPMKLHRAVAQEIRGLSAGWLNHGRIVPVCVVLLCLFLQACSKRSDHEPVTLTLLEEWSDKRFSDARQQELQQFTRETGIRVRLLPSPDSARQRLALWKELLETGASGPDVYGIDVIWPGMLGQYFVNLETYFASEISLQFPEVAGNYIVDGKLVAVPYRADIGLLYYRTDLLRDYGYREPPETWDELETMAARIQAGERAKGKKQFWGYVWQGAADEALTCNALEWQASEGGGRIIEENHAISVNNPQAIRAWQRAAHWVGSISPPGVVGYREWDSLNVWVAGDAAFLRHWPSAYLDSQGAGSAIRNKFDAAPLPGGKAGRVGTAGGWGLAISRSSAHPREALELVRFLTRKDVQVKRTQVVSQPPTLPELYNLAEVRDANPHFELLRQAFLSGAVSRPSNITGERYQDVSDAYIHAVHSVLTGEKPAPDAAAALENELVRITGFKTGSPAGKAVNSE